MVLIDILGINGVHQRAVKAGHVWKSPAERGINVTGGETFAQFHLGLPRSGDVAEAREQAHAYRAQGIPPSLRV
jgi:hypothetical protein